MKRVERELADAQRVIFLSCGDGPGDVAIDVAMSTCVSVCRQEVATAPTVKLEA